MKLLTLCIVFLAACGPSTVSTAQQLASPVHLVPEVSGAAMLDINAEGVGVCAEGDVSIAIEWASGDTRAKVAEVTHQGQVGAAAYGWGKDKQGWYVERMADVEGARLYPGPFARCSRPEALRAPAPRAVLWREGRGQ